MGGDPLLMSFVVVIIGGLGSCVERWSPHFSSGFWMV